MKTILASPFMAFAALVTFTSPTASQCLGPDNLTGPCCQPTAVNLPIFPDIQMPGMGICWNQCAPTNQVCTDLEILAPMPVTCDEYRAELNVVDCATGVLYLRGELILDYTRTWKETDPGVPGSQWQVWRFAAKVDVSPGVPLVPGATNCPQPVCLFTQPTAFYYGYMDYAFDCVNNTYEASLVLHHGCDSFQHDPLLSDKPGFFHPGESYALVGPNTSANPFTPALMPATGGPVIAEAMRLAATPGLGGCVFEEPIAQGDVQVLGMACLCPFAFIPVVTARHMGGVGVCPGPTGVPSNYRSLNFFPALPWYEVITTSIGMWSSNANYPGPEQAWVDEGIFLYTDSCAATAGLPSNFADLMYGGSTARGFLVQGFGGIALTDRFTDLASNWSHTLGTPVALPLLGSVRQTDHLIYTNNL